MSHIGEFIFETYGKTNSAIINFKEMIELEKLCGLKIIGKRLLYRASVDGYASTDFHRKCDNTPNTLTVIKSEHGHVFGGFTPLTWDGSGNKTDAKTFLFSLINKEAKPEKMVKNTSVAKRSIYCGSRYGPVFGTGNDIIIGSKYNEANTCNSNPSETFIYSNVKSNDLFAGSEYFKVIDMEVYQI